VSAEQKETGRVEAFSDGVFAFAITLLVLNLRDPTTGNVPLIQALTSQWESLFALVTSFSTILIMWVNHHSMFSRIKRIDTALLFLNGLLLFFVVLQPFTTLLVADHVSLSQSPDGTTAAAIYSGCCLLLGLVWTAMGWYAGKTQSIAGDTSNRGYAVGPISYAVAFGLSFINALASVVLILAIAAYFAVYAGTYMRAAMRSKEKRVPTVDPDLNLYSKKKGSFTGT